MILYNEEGENEMTRKEKEVLDLWNRQARERYVDALESGDLALVEEWRSKFVVLTNLTRALENANNEAGA